MPSLLTSGYEMQTSVPKGGGDTDGFRAPPIVDTSGGIRALGSAVVEVMQKENTRRDQIDLMQYEQKLSELDQAQLLGDEQNPGGLRQMGTNAAGVTKRTLESWDKQATALQPKLRSPDAQLRAEHLRHVRRQDNQEKLTNHEYREGEIAYKQTSEALRDTYRNSALANADDPKAVEADMARARAVVLDAAKRNHEPPEVTALKLGQEDSATLNAVITSQLTRKPELALTTFRANVGRLLGADRITMQARLRPFELDAIGRSVGDAKWDGTTPAEFEGIAAQVLHTEGGYVENDGGKGPTNFGINSVANPDIDVKNLTPIQAKAIYKARYWDAIHADQLPPAIRAQAFDAAVNQGVGAAKEMLAESGGDPVKFAELRRERYRDLIAKNPGKYAKYEKSWMRRVDDMQAKSLPTNALAMTDEAITARESVLLTSTDNLPTEEATQAKERIRERATRARMLVQNNSLAKKSAQDELVGQYNNTVAKLADGIPVPLPERPTKESLIAGFGEYEGAQKFDEMQTYASAAPDAALLKLAGPEQAQAIIARYTPDAKSQNYPFADKLQHDLALSYQQIQSQRNANPATFLMTNSPAVQASYAAVSDAQENLAKVAPENQAKALETLQLRGNAFVKFMQEEQARLGVPVKNRVILPASARLAISDKFDQHMQKGDVAGAVQVMRGALLPFGDGAAAIIPQLGKDQGMVARLALEGIDTRTVETYAAAAQQGDAELQKAIGTGNWNAINTAVNVELANLDATGSSEWGAYRDATVKIAAAKLRMLGALGDPAEVAAQAAGELVNDRYAFGGTGERISYRVPKADVQGRTINTDAVMQGAAGTLQGLTIADFTASDAKQPGVAVDEFKALRLARIQRTGVWVNDPHETGLILGYTDDNARFVRVLDAKGKPLVRTWAQLQQAKAKNEAVQNELRRKVQSAAAIGAGL